ncbi:MAG: hypothetical protein U0U69_13850 [Acidimicrobiia bacterium]
MNRQRLAGALAATSVAGPVWTILAVERPHVVWFNAAVALAYFGFAVLVGLWVTRQPRSRSWLAERGAVATWIGLGGLVAAPAVIVRLAPVLAAVALGGLALVVIVLSPVLSVRATEVLERFLAPDPEVRSLPKLNEHGAHAPSSLVRTLPPVGSGPRAA